MILGVLFTAFKSQIKIMNVTRISVSVGASSSAKFRGGFFYLFEGWGVLQNLS